MFFFFFFFSSRRRHTRCLSDWSSDVCSSDLLQTIKDFPILILDDWGAQSDTPWADEQLYLILNHRTERALPTVVTSNQPLKDIEPRVRSEERRVGKGATARRASERSTTNSRQ